MQKVGEATKQLAETMENSLGKDAPKSFDKLEKAAENGTNKVYTYFKNLGTRIKEDLSSAFDLSKVTVGLSALKGLGSGISQVLDMEKAFDKLNTRLGLTNKQLDQFKTNVGRRVAATGQDIESVLPGVETVAAKGGMKDTGQLAAVAELLGQMKATTGEETGGIADKVVEMLKDQGKEITAGNFKAAMDAISKTRVTGAFKGAEDAAHAMQSITAIISPEKQKKLGLGTAQIGGLVAAASKAGEGGQAILQKILETSTKAGGQALLNSLFSTQLFKGGKLDTKAMAKMSKKGLGAYSEQVLAETTGVGQADLSRFIEAMRDNQKDLSAVANSSNETAKQFEMATDNLAGTIDKFKHKTMQAGLEVGTAFGELGNHILGGKFQEAKKDIAKVGKKIWENKETLLKAGAGVIGGAVLAGGGINSLLKKIGGGGIVGQGAGMAKDIAIAKELKAAGIEVQPVMVINAQEIGDAASKGTGDLGDKLGDLAKEGGGGKFGKVLSIGGKVLGAAGAVVGAGAAGAAVGTAAYESNFLGVKTGSGKLTDKIYDFFNKDKDRAAVEDAKKNARENFARLHPHKTIMPPPKHEEPKLKVIPPIHHATKNLHPPIPVHHSTEELHKALKKTRPTLHPFTIPSGGHIGHEDDDMNEARAKLKAMHMAIAPGDKAKGGDAADAISDALDPDAIKSAVSAGTAEGMIKANESMNKDKLKPLTNPSDLSGNRGAKV